MSADERPQESNPNLEYTSEYLALLEALRGKPERHYGGKTQPAEEPDWEDVEERAKALATRTLDLFVEVARVRSEAHRIGLQGLARAWRRLAELLRSEWPTLQPMLDDDGDPMRRLNILSSLVAWEEGVSDLRAAVWIKVPSLGVCLVRQAESVLAGSGAVSEVDESFDRAQLTGFVRAAAAGGQPNVAQQALDALRELELALSDRVGEGRGVDFALLARILRPLAAFHASESDSSVAKASGDSPLPEPASQGSRSPSKVGKVATRQDVVHVLDEVCVYLEREEPTNPAPLLLRRAQRLMRMSFVDIVREMAPEGMDSVDKVLGPFPRRDE